MAQPTPSRPFDPDAQSRALVLAEAARIARAAAFARTRVAALRALAETAPDLARRLDALAAAAKDAEAIVASARTADPAEAHRRIRAFDYAALLDGVRGLEAAAAAARTGRPAAEPARAPTPGPLTGRLRELAARLDPTQAPVLRPLLAAPAPPPADRRVLEGLEAALKLVADVLGYVAPRLAPVAVALDASQAPGATPLVARLAAARRAAEAEVEEPLRGWVPPLVRLFVDHEAPRRPARVAVTQWRQAGELRLEAEVARGVALDAPPERRTELLRGIRAERLRGAVLPLGNLHLTFREVPLLQELFPPPKGRPPAP